MNDGDVRATVGLVKIEITNSDESQASEEIQAAFEALKIPDVLEPPDSKAEETYKIARIKWHHKIESDTDFDKFKENYLKQNGIDVLQNLKSEEVLPGYFTIVDPGASERYQKDGKLFLVHRIYHPNKLDSVLKYGLLSSSERYKRGCHLTGMSTRDDFEYGGADSVFLRIATGIEQMRDRRHARAVLVIDSSELDRTDWYAYGEGDLAKQIQLYLRTAKLQMTFSILLEINIIPQTKL